MTPTASHANTRKSFDMLKRVMPGEEVVPYPEPRSTRRTSRTRAAPAPVAKRGGDFTSVIPDLTKEQLVHALRAAQPGSLEFSELARALAALE